MANVAHTQPQSRQSQFESKMEFDGKIWIGTVWSLAREIMFSRRFIVCKNQQLNECMDFILINLVAAVAADGGDAASSGRHKVREEKNAATTFYRELHNNELGANVNHFQTKADTKSGNFKTKQQKIVIWRTKWNFRYFVGILRLCKCIVWKNGARKLAYMQSTCAIATAHRMRIKSVSYRPILSRPEIRAESICRCVMAPAQAATYYALSLLQCFPHVCVFHSLIQCINWLISLYASAGRIRHCIACPFRCVLES